MNETDTPLTDAFLHGRLPCSQTEIDAVAFARDLERKFNAANARIAEQEKQIEKILDGSAELAASALVKISELEEHLDGMGIHTHSDSCQQPACVLRKELKTVRAELERAEHNWHAAEDELKAAKEHHQQELSDERARSDRLAEALEVWHQVYGHGEPNSGTAKLLAEHEKRKASRNA